MRITPRVSEPLPLTPALAAAPPRLSPTFSFPPQGAALALGRRGCGEPGGGRLAGSPGRPRALPHRGSRLPRPRGPALGCREPARAARGCGSGAAEAAGKVRARPTAVSSECRGRRSEGRRQGPGRAPPRLRPPPPRGSPAAPSPRGAWPGGGSCRPPARRSCPGRAQGPQTPASTAGGRLRQGGETQKKGKKKAQGRKGKNFYFFSYSGAEVKGRRLRQRELPGKGRRDPSLLRAAEPGPGGPKGRPPCGTLGTLSATGRTSSPGRRHQSCGWTRCWTWSGSWSAANST